MAEAVILPFRSEFYGPFVPDIGGRCAEDRPGQKLGWQSAGAEYGIIDARNTQAEVEKPGYSEKLGITDLNVLVGIAKAVANKHAERQIQERAKNPEDERPAPLFFDLAHDLCGGRGALVTIKRQLITDPEAVWKNVQRLEDPAKLDRAHFEATIEATERQLALEATHGPIQVGTLPGEKLTPLLRNPGNPDTTVTHQGPVSYTHLTLPTNREV